MDAYCGYVLYIVQPRAAEEMLKKVNIFSDMWKNGKISYPVKSTMARLATGLQLAYMKSLLTRRRSESAYIRQVML